MKNYFQLRSWTNIYKFFTLYTGSGHEVLINYSSKSKTLVLKKLNDNSFKNRPRFCKFN